MINSTVSIHAPVQGATGDLSDVYKMTVVSIHAPVQGATQMTKKYQHILKVSIHAPVQGATSNCSGYFCASISFNPRTRAGCDCYFAYTPFFMGSFNPRTRAGCDFRYSTSHNQAKLFQSTHPCRVRLTLSGY